MQVRMQGGLQVLVLAIQESERVDRQLKGRAGRQGDPGETYSLVRVDDPLTRSAGVEGGLQLIQPFLKGASFLLCSSYVVEAAVYLEGHHQAICHEKFLLYA